MAHFVASLFGEGQDESPPLPGGVGGIEDLQQPEGGVLGQRKAAAGSWASTHSHVALLLGEVAGYVSEGGGCTGPETHTRLTDCCKRVAHFTLTADFQSYLRILMASSLSGLKNSKFS